MANVTMPQLGETVIEGTIIKWLKSEGDRVEMDEPLFEISTDKVDTEVPSPAAGVVSRILVPEGQTVAVGTELAQIDAGDAAATGDGAGPADVPASAPTTKAPRVPSPSPAEPAPKAPSAPSETPSAPPEAPSAPSEAPPPAPPVTAAARGGLPDRGPRSGILSPLVRKLAVEHGVDLVRVTGTGTGGRITKNDVLAFAAAVETSPTPQEAPPAAPPRQEPSPPTPPAATPVEMPAVAPPPATVAEGEEIVPLSHLRKAIATHMVASVQTTARAWTMVEVDMENVVRLRERAKEAFLQREGFKLTYMPFVTRATVDALVAYPMVNAELRGEDVVLHRHVNMGIAVSIEGGLIVPVVKGAEGMSLVGLATGINDVATRARGKQLQPDEVHGSTFSITNPGPFGSLMSVPIINQPNTAILAFDAVEKRPVVIDDAIAIRHRVYLSMSWDHRVIDGAMASEFLSRVKHDLETWDFAEDL